MSLKDKVIFISGGSRGIGLAMVKKAAEDGAKIAIAAKTAEPHPKLPGTIYTAADEIVEAGGEALPVICDIRNEDNVRDAINQTVDHFSFGVRVPLTPPISSPKNLAKKNFQ